MSSFVSPKKHLGQHFLRDENIARKIVSSLSKKNYKTIVEVGAGTGVLTKYLLQEKDLELFVVEIDKESISFLKKNHPILKDRMIEKDFLEFSSEWLPSAINHQPFSIIGNFPYNISSQILFKVLECRNQIPEVVGMFQKEVAQRIASPPGNKTYGILSVLMQAFYKIEYLFTVNENVFIPPPKVKSAVICLTRNETEKLNCDEKLFFEVVKTAFNQRRKTLRNALSKFEIKNSKSEILNKRAEQLSVNDFVELTKEISSFSLYGRANYFKTPKLSNS
ncbi:MAG: 16S rRNA (adenine(1518)-N(6)/adenine(1519)-N(6))-dimethyltransferase RsmA [Bacteroidetes bacterium]|nr:16S rRNA (adenine(1518)-N(6)/adenine(1519)-N(6))-dimethyltransferase RsmA [Bacteroidota bacterium]